MQHRRQRLHSLVAFAAIVWCAVPCRSADPVTLHLRNGDRLTGEILREDARRLILRSPVTGRITVPIDQIERRSALQATNAAVTQAAPPAPTPTPAAPVAPATAATAPAAVPAATAPGVAPKPVVSTNVPPGKPSGIGAWIPGWIAAFSTNWHGNVGLGMNLGFGTTDRQTFFVNANATHQWDRVANAVNYSAAYGLVNEVESANRMDGTLKTDVFVDRTRHLYLYNLGLGGYDLIRHINLRLEEGIGVGYKVYDRNRLVVNAELGGQVQYFDYGLQADRTLWSVRVSESLNWKPSTKLTVTQRLQYMPNVSDPSDYRIRLDLIAAYPLYKRLTVSFNVVNEYENRPPRTADNNDLQITTNINVTF
jgi:hypothetical protein